MDNPSRLRSIHTRCTCCHPDHAGESGLDRTHTRVRNLKSRTIHSASRRHGARESGLSHTRIRARSSSNRNVCILLPYLFFLSPHIIPHGLSPRHTPAPNWKLATLGLATLSHWQHFRIARWGERTRLRALRAVGRAHTLARPSGCLRQCSLRGFASSVHVLGEPPTSPDESHDITSRAAVSMNGVKSCRPSRPPNSFRRLIDGYSTTLTPPTGPDPRMPRCGVLCGMPTAPSATCHCTGRPAQARRSRWRLSPYRTACR